MGKIKDELIDDEIGNKIEPVLTHTALSMAQIPGEGWSLIKIKYNPVTGDVGKIEKFFSGEMRMYIEEKYKIETITSNIFNNSGNSF